MERTMRRHPDDPHHITKEWFVAHRAFHAKLLEPCRFELLMHTAATLADATLLYRQLAAPSPQSEARDSDAEHRAILEATLARDAPLAARLLREHYTRTLTVVTAALGLDTGAASPAAAAV
jgi:DNA-binding GntR family transcriptional regulator